MKKNSLFILVALFFTGAAVAMSCEELEQGAIAAGKARVAAKAKIVNSTTGSDINIAHAKFEAAKNAIKRAARTYMAQQNGTFTIQGLGTFSTQGAKADKTLIVALKQQSRKQNYVAPFVAVQKNFYMAYNSANKDFQNWRKAKSQFKAAFKPFMKQCTSDEWRARVAAVKKTYRPSKTDLGFKN